jgi:hypothetical protein
LWSYQDQSRPCLVVCGDAPPHSDEWEGGFVPAGAPTLKLVRCEAKVLRVENEVFFSYEWGVYIAYGAGPRPLMDVINGCRKTIEKSCRAVNTHHSDIIRYNLQEIFSVDLDHVSWTFPQLDRVRRVEGANFLG